VGGGAYGLECWKALWRVVDPSRLGASLLYEGDSMGTLSRSENVYVVAIQPANQDTVARVRAALEQSEDFGRLAASPAFVDGHELAREPLVGAGAVEADGTVVGTWAGPALDLVLEERAAVGAPVAATVAAGPGAAPPAAPASPPEVQPPPEPPPPPNPAAREPAQPVAAIAAAPPPGEAEVVDQRARWAQIALGAGVVMAAVSFFFALERQSLLSDTGSLFRSEVEASDDKVRTVGWIGVVVYLTVAAVFLAWFHRAYSNLERLQVGPLRYTKGWAIGAWFVPILALFRPKQLANDLTRGSDPDLPANDPNWTARPYPDLVTWWWATWLIANLIGGQAFSRSLNAQTIDEHKSVATLTLISDVFLVGAGVLAILFVNEVTSRQKQRMARIAAGSLPVAGAPEAASAAPPPAAAAPQPAAAAPPPTGPAQAPSAPAAPAAGPPQWPTEMPKVPMPRVSRRVLAIGAAAALAIGVVVAGALLLTGGDDDDPGRDRPANAIAPGSGGSGGPATSAAEDHRQIIEVVQSLGTSEGCESLSQRLLLRIYRTGGTEACLDDAGQAVGIPGLTVKFIDQSEDDRADVDVEVIPEGGAEPEAAPQQLTIGVVKEDGRWKIDSIGF
jgi:hypothetical protein